MTLQAVILAGGLGTRLATRLGGRPKALAEVAGQPLLDYQLRLCARHGFTDVILLLGHSADAVHEFVGDGSAFGIKARTVVETEPRGTAGAVLEALPLLAERFLVLYADTMLDVDLGRLWDAHIRRGAAATLLVHPNDHPFDSDLVVVDPQDRIVEFLRGSAIGDRPIRNLASAALYAVERTVLSGLAYDGGILDFGKHVFPGLLARGAILRAYRSVEYIKDAGTPDRLDHVNEDRLAHRVRPEASGRARPAVFLDRDGTLNEEIGGVLAPEQLTLIPGAAGAVKRLNKAGLATIVITNQPFIARGDISESELDAIHARLEQKLAGEGAYVDAIYHCPHHPHAGFPGERPDLKISCICRKPKPGLILRAADQLALDLTDAWMVGDRLVDVAAGRRAGIRTILLRTGHGGRDDSGSHHPDYVFPDLPTAADFILDRFPKMLATANTMTTTLQSGAEIVIGGPARAGKSVWASIFAEALKKQNLVPFLLSLDNWLLDPTERGSGGVEERYDMDGVAEFLAGLRQLTEPTDLALPSYDRHARRRRQTPEIRRFIPGSVILLEGVLALKVPELSSDALRIGVRIPEDLRRERFVTDYRWRGWTDEEIEKVYRQRLADELPIVEDSCSSASFVLNGTQEETL